MIETANYENTVTLLSAYRYAKSLTAEDFNEALYESLHYDVKEAKEAYDKAKKIVSTVDNGLINLRYRAINGYRFHKVLYYRYIIEKPLSEREILSRLSMDGIAKKKTTYYNLWKEAQIVLTHFIFGDELEVECINDIIIPEQENEKK